MPDSLDATHHADRRLLMELTAALASAGLSDAIQAMPPWRIPAWPTGMCG